MFQETSQAFQLQLLKDLAEIKKELQDLRDEKDAARKNNPSKVFEDLEVTFMNNIKSEFDTNPSASLEERKQILHNLLTRSGANKRFVIASDEIV